MSGHLVRASRTSLAALVLIQSAGVRAESFEVVRYAPPRGWPVQNLQDGRAYMRPDGNGVITFYASRSDSNLAPQAFAVTWRSLVEPIVPGPAPEPQIRREGDFTVASGARHARSNNKAVAVSLVTVTGLGRTLGILGMAGDDEALRELTAFFDTVAFTAPGPPWVPASSPADLVGRWWKVASTAGGDRYYWYEFTDKGLYSYETPFQERQTGTFRVQDNRITLTTTTGHATSRSFAFECVGSKLRLEFRDEKTGAGDGYWSEKAC
jgi:hypothetical protein